MAKGISRTKDRSRWGLYKNIFALIAANAAFL